MTIAQDVQQDQNLNGLPTVSYFINYGTKEKPYGEVHFSDDRLVVGFASGRVWARKGGRAVKEIHYRKAYEYLIRAGLAKYRKFSKDRIGKPSK